MEKLSPWDLKNKARKEILSNISNLVLDCNTQVVYINDDIEIILVRPFVYEIHIIILDEENVFLNIRSQKFTCSTGMHKSEISDVIKHMKEVNGYPLV